MRKWLGPLFLVLILSGCSHPVKQMMIPEDVLQHVVESNDQPIAYHAKATMEFDFDGKTAYEIEEWQDGDLNRKVEVVETNGARSMTTINDEGMFIYSEQTKDAFHFPFNKVELPAASLNSQKEFTMNAIKLWGDDADIEMLTDQKFLKRKTTIVQIKDGETGEKLSDMWVDQETWLALKVLFYTDGEVSNRFEYSYFDTKPQFTANFFTIELPEGMEWEEKSFDLPETNVLTMEEVEAELNQTPLLIQDDTYPLQVITQMKDKEKTLQYDYNYGYQEEVTVSVQQVNEHQSEEATKIEIRGTTGSYFSANTLQFVDFTENGLSYSVITNEPRIQRKEFLQLIENMK